MKTFNTFLIPFLILTANISFANKGNEEYKNILNSTAILGANSSDKELKTTVKKAEFGVCGCSGPIEGSSEASTVIIDNENFERGWGIWNDGGYDSRRNPNDAAYSNGNFSIRLKGNSPTSYTQTDLIDLSAFGHVTVTLSYFLKVMDKSNKEDFELQLSTDGGDKYQKVKAWKRRSTFLNNERYKDTITIEGPFTDNVRLRFVNNAKESGDRVYIDDIKISGCSPLPSAKGTLKNISLDEVDGEDVEQVYVYPNPFVQNFTIDLEEMEEAGKIMLLDFNGKEVFDGMFTAEDEKVKVKTHNLEKGVYYLKVETNNSSITKRILKSK